MLEKEEIKEVNKRKGKGIVTVIIVLIVLGLLVFGVLLLTGVISFSKDEPKEEVKTEEKKENIPEIDREIIISNFKEKLNDKKWVEDNLYSKKDCFDENINVTTQSLEFVMFDDESNKPIVIINNSSRDGNFVICYKIYYEDNEVKVKNVTSFIGNPNHGVFMFDKKQGLVVYEFEHMGLYKRTAYDVRKDEISIFEEYSCEDCMGYEGNKSYVLESFSTILNKENIDSYIK